MNDKQVLLLVIILQFVALITNRWTVIMTNGIEIDISPFRSMRVNHQTMSFPPAQDAEFPTNTLLACRILLLVAFVATILALVGLYHDSRHSYKLVLLSLLSMLVAIILWLACIDSHVNSGLPAPVSTSFGFSLFVEVLALLISIGVVVRARQELRN